MVQAEDVKVLLEIQKETRERMIGIGTLDFNGISVKYLETSILREGFSKDSRTINIEFMINDVVFKREIIINQEKIETRVDICLRILDIVKEEITNVFRPHVIESCRNYTEGHRDDGKLKKWK